MYNFTTMNKFQKVVTVMEKPRCLNDKEYFGSLRKEYVPKFYQFTNKEVFCVAIRIVETSRGSQASSTFQTLVQMLTNQKQRISREDSVTFKAEDKSELENSHFQKIKQIIAIFVLIV